MAKKKPEEKTVRRSLDPNVMGLRGAVVDQPITVTLDENYMPYAMSVIVSRAIPEIDGFKPAHRKLLYTMYKMGLLTGSRTKSANIVGQTMRLNPHGDAAIYETMVRLSKGNEALLHPFVDSKGNFGKVYSRDMAYAASRYTEAKLSPICAELFRDLDCDAVDFVDNYDNTTKEPSLLPTTYPHVLVSANQGIAVGVETHGLTHDVGALGAAAGQQPHFIHGVQQLPVGGLEAVDLRNGAGHDDAHGVGHVVLVQRPRDGLRHHRAPQTHDIGVGGGMDGFRFCFLLCHER